jgi:hypothetical protein
MKLPLNVILNLVGPGYKLSGRGDEEYYQENEKCFSWMHLKVM